MVDFQVVKQHWQKQAVLQRYIKKEANYFTIAMLRAKNSKKIINFIDLGSGGGFERIDKMGQKPKKGSPRQLIAIDLERQLKRTSQGTRYLCGDAVAHLKGLILKYGVKANVINADNFFAEQIVGKQKMNHLRGKARCDAAIEQPIDPELLTQIKEILAKNGRLYATTTRWHCIPLAQKLKEAGFEVFFRPITKKEAEEGSSTTKQFYELWSKGEFYDYFGKEGWELQRLVAIKRK